MLEADEDGAGISVCFAPAGTPEHKMRDYEIGEATTPEEAMTVAERHFAKRIGKDVTDDRRGALQAQGRMDWRSTLSPARRLPHRIGFDRECSKPGARRFTRRSRRWP